MWTETAIVTIFVCKKKYEVAPQNRKLGSTLTKCLEYLTYFTVALNWRDGTVKEKQTVIHTQNVPLEPPLHRQTDRQTGVSEQSGLITKTRYSPLTKKQKLFSQ